MTLTIGVDVGGTKVAAGVVDEAGAVLAQTRRDTPADDVAKTRDVIIEAVAELARGREIEAVGIGAAGWIDATRSTVLFAPNIAWRDEPLRDYVTAATGLPVIVENDGNAAAWAEFRFGAARHAEDSMVMYTIGTGVGGAIVLGGELVRGTHGVAAELGHMLAVPDGHLCGCGRHGCLEQYASGNALVRFARAGARQDPSSAAALLDLADGDAEAITGPMVTAAAMEGDPVSRQAFAQIGHWLGVALADMVQILDPQMLVVGGGVVEAGELLLGPTRRSFMDSLAQRVRVPVAEIKAAEMGNAAGVVGAGDLARRR
ncbi:ROK family glucokinase [Phytohabitans flavus]|uniref:Glucokinase n=1 Tax=Phytohabitans flavus TaxID=1076124 RepID=A0A6F8XYL5_9ACTN|nr:ROK family glucokinase [Phytohabitans flavus]BCB78897.1 glucokinase [Phytohabitans flavus]